MTNNVHDAAPRGAQLADDSSLSVPTGLQANAELGRRRVILMVLNVATWLAMLWLGAQVLGAGGWTVVDFKTNDSSPTDAHRRQLAHYIEAVRQASDKPVSGILFYL